MSFDEFRASGRRAPYVLRMRSGAGELLYYGAAHTFQPADSQVAHIEHLWQAFRPTIAFNEGGDPPVQPTLPLAVERSGEAGLVRFLAARDTVPVESLEPSRDREVSLLLRDFSVEQLKLFYVLRQVAQFAHGHEPQWVDTFVEGQVRLVSRYAGLQGEPRSLDELRSVCRRLLPSLADCRAITPDWFDPTLSPPRAFTNVVSRASGVIRDRHMISLLTAAVSRGERVFAVAGIGHVAMQERALRSAIQGAR